MNNTTHKQLEDHLEISKYGDFQLSDGIRPYMGCVPMQGFKHKMWKDIPAVLGSVSKEIILEIFYEMLDLMNGEINVILESSHDIFDGDSHYNYFREGMDLTILRSILVEYEDLLVDDGQFGIAVWNFGDKYPVEIQLDEHKVLICYGKNIEKFEQIFEMYGLVCNENLQVLSEMTHVHISSEDFHQRFLELKNLIGVE